MTRLVIDTATRFCSVGVFAEGGTMLAGREEDLGRGHAERLPALAPEILAQAGIEWRDLTNIVVTIGPGSFTGIRVGVAYARGLGLALGLPVVGVTTLETLAMLAFREAAPAAAFAALVDGGRGTLRAQIFSPGPSAQSEAFAGTREEIEDRLAAASVTLVVGDGAAAFPLIASVAADRAVGTLADCAAAALHFSQPPVPLYMRGADAKSQDGFALAHAEPEGLAL